MFSDTPLYIVIAKISTTSLLNYSKSFKKKTVILNL
jgi:hypothetical protein